MAKKYVTALVPVSDSGTRRETGEQFLMREEEIPRHVTAGLVEESHEPQRTPVVASTALEWPLKITPEEYLAKFPTGPKIELAKTLVERAKVKADGEAS